MQRLPTVPIPIPSGIFYGWVVVAVGVLIGITAAPGGPIVYAFFITPMSADLGVSRAALTLAITFRLIAGAATAPLMGVIIDKFGPRWLSVVSGLVAGGCLIALGFTHEIWVVYLLFTLSGMAGLGGGPGGQLIVSVPVAKWFSAKRGRAMAITSAGGVAGTALSIMVAQTLIHGIGWRETSIIFGIVLLAFTIPMSILFLRGSPEELGLHPDGTASAAEPGALQKPGTRDAESGDWSLGQALRTPTTWMIITALTVGGVALNGTLINRVSYWEDVGVSPGIVALGTAADPFSVMFSVLLFGTLAQRMKVRHFGLIAGAGFGLAMLPMIFTTGQAYTVFAHNIIWGLLGGGGFVTYQNLVWPTYFGRKFLGTIRGVTVPLTVGANALGAPLYGFLLGSSLDPRIVWSISMGAFSFLAALLFLAKPPQPRRGPPPLVPTDPLRHRSA